MIPILLLGVLGTLVGWSVRHKMRILDVTTPTVSSGAVVRRDHRKQLPPRVRSVAREVSYIDLLNRMVEEDHDPSNGLVDAAYDEAIRLGDRVTAISIQTLYYDDDDTAEEESVTEVEEAEEDGEFDLDGLERIEATGDVEGGSRVSVPIEGVEPDQWQEFSAALKTQSSDYTSPRRLGAWEHNRHRLRTLGIEDAKLATEEGQYHAFCEDIKEYVQSSDKLLRDYTGDSVTIDGEDHPVTRSGVLALLKTAGPSGAQSWLANSEDRTKYPFTTKTFLNANNCF